MQFFDNDRPGSANIQRFLWRIALGIDELRLAFCSPARKADGNSSKNVPKRAYRYHPELFVTQSNLAPGAPLAKTVEGHDVLIVGLSDGERVNEAKSPPVHITIRNGSVVLMPREETYLLRNAGNQEIDVLVMHTGR